MNLKYKRRGNQIFAILKKGLFDREVVGQLKFRIKRGKKGLVLAIDDIGVNKEYQNKGIGKGLTYQAIQFARKTGCDFVVALAQPQYLGLLESFGFETNGNLAKLSL
jgi:predicted N-acetyltransferase YhbS